MFRCAATFKIVSSLAASNAAAGLKHYANSRFGYSVDLPAGFKTVSVPENGDGVVLESVDGRTKLSVWETT